MRLLDHGNSRWSYAFFRMIETALGIGAAMCGERRSETVETQKPGGMPADASIGRPNKLCARRPQLISRS